MIPSRPLYIGDIINETFKMSWKTLLRVAIVALILSAASTFVYVWGISGVVERGYTVLEKDYPLDSASVSTFRTGVLKEIKEENPLLLAIYFPDIKVDIDDEIKKVADTTQVDSSQIATDTTQVDSLEIATNTTHIDSLQIATDSLSTVATIDSRNYLEETGDFFVDNSEAIFGIFDGIFFASIVTILIAIFLSTFILDICIRYFEERKLNIIAALTTTLRRNVWMSILMYLLMIFILLFGFGAMIGIAAIMPVALEVLLIVFAVGMLVLTGVRLMFAQAALVSEDLGPWESLHRSWTLTQGHFWRIVGIVIVLFMIIIVFQTIVQAIIGIFDMTNAEMIKGLIAGDHTNVKAAIDELISLMQISSIQSLITTVLFITFSPSLLTVMYYDLRTRKDGPLTYPEEVTSLP
ncbi:MAG TPA: hypothetical protein VIX80_05275 [Candidatus Kapabacteria bacterium]